MSVPYNQTCKTDYAIFMLSKLDGSLVPRPSPSPVLDCLQYENGVEGLGEFITSSASI